ncbi:MAG: transposase family protein [Syntrophaceae bacterium]|nr:MAG: transposase family protein [Syntrophaceae bacterium]
METGISYSKRKLHGKKYFRELLGRVEDISPSVRELMEMSRGGMEMFQAAQKKLIAALRYNAQIKERVERLMTIPSIGEITALT